ncbi:MAG: YceI family protein [Pyrinomonadaceae bacterium]|nr:YceI family protein [Sphingobacteriaceae bacterium]
MIFVKRNNRLLFLFAICLCLNTATIAQNLVSKNAKVRFFSSTPIEDIKAVSEKGVVVIIPKTGEIAFQVAIATFDFDKGLMEEHFNENYMESPKFPFARFNGKISPFPDLTKDGEYTVTATGNLLIHGVLKQRTIPGKITVSNGKAKLISAFDVACAEHSIKIPKLVFTKVAEVIKVNIETTLIP